MKLTMPGVLSWVLGGNAEQLSAEDRAPSCRLSDKPRGFDESQFPLLMRDDDALLRASRAHWLLQPVPPAAAAAGLPIQLPAVEISGCPSILVGSADNCHVVVECPAVAKNHAIIEQQDGDYFVRDLVSVWGGICVQCVHPLRAHTHTHAAVFVAREDRCHLPTNHRVLEQEPGSTTIDCRVTASASCTLEMS